MLPDRGGFEFWTPVYMPDYSVQVEISGPTALWSRPDTVPNPVSYVAPTFSAAKGIFEAVLRWKSVNVRPRRNGFQQLAQL
jgi:CRISPR-associated protein Cas5d